MIEAATPDPFRVRLAAHLARARAGEDTRVAELLAVILAEYDAGRAGPVVSAGAYCPSLTTRG